MKIILISYGDIDYDGRLRSLLEVFSRMGEVKAFTRGKRAFNRESRLGNTKYIKFVREAIKFAKRQGHIDWLVLDNRKATVPGLFIRKSCKPEVIIQDCRELYLINEVKHFSGKIGCVFEKMMSCKSDIVICANDERAKIMQKEYGIVNTPITYENLRQLQYESSEEVQRAKERFKKYIIEGEIRIISTSGCSSRRTNDILVRNLDRVEKKCRLFLVGDSTSDEEKRIKDIIYKRNISNVEILGRLNQTELKYLISESHIGVVNYGQYDTNNRLCASGKLYEFIYEGIPVITTTNPPLKGICDEYMIGEADDDYAFGINKILGNYDAYKKNVLNYSKEFTIEKNDSSLVSNLNYFLGQKM